MNPASGAGDNSKPWVISHGSQNVTEGKVEITFQHCCTHPGTGLCMCDCHDDGCACGLAGSGAYVGYSYVMRDYKRSDS